MAMIRVQPVEVQVRAGWFDGRPRELTWAGQRLPVREIVSIQLRGLRDRLAARKLTLRVGDAAVEFLAGEGYDPTYGARPLKRVIQRRLQDPIAMAILEGRFSDGDTVDVDAADGQLTIAGGHEAAVPEAQAASLEV